MWKLRTRIIPVIVGVLGIIKKGSQQHIFKKIPENHSLREIQKLSWQLQPTH